MVLLRAPRALANRPIAPGSPHSKQIRPNLPTAARRRAGGFLHHLLHFPELFEQPIDFADRTARSFRDPGAARAIHDLRLLPLLERHRENDRLEVLESLGIGGLRLLE